MMHDVKAEIAAMAVIHEAIEPLDDSGRARVLNYFLSLFDISTKESHSKDSQAAAPIFAATTAEKDKEIFATLAELFDKAGPKTNAEKVLVAGYWLQVCQGRENFGALAANKELTNLGHQMTHITEAFDSNKSCKPSLILQLKKSGSSQQARKTYKLSQAGINRVEELTRG